MELNENRVKNQCRVCLTNTGKWLIFNLYGNDELNIKELFEMYTGIQLNEEDSMPKRLCLGCLKKLIDVHKFITQCKTADTILHTLENLWNFEIPAGYKIVLVEDTKNDVDSESFSIPAKTEREEILDEMIPRELENHLEVDHKIELIEDSENNLDDLQENLRVKVKEIESLLPEPDEIFVTNDDNMEEDSCDEQEDNTCNICYKSFKRKPNFIHHMNLHTIEAPYKCETCNKRFICQTERQQHIMLEHNESDLFICDVCGKGFKTDYSLKKHLDMHSTSLFCSICKKWVLDEDGSFNQHMESHSGLKKYLCNCCGKAFKTNASLQIHLVIHTGERPYKCEYCGKGFTQRSALKSHSYIHTGVKPYECKTCGKGFKMSGQLNYHIFTHTGEKRHSCTYCGKRFALKGNLRQHIASHSNDRPYTCTVCSRNFKSRNNLRKHFRLHSEIKIDT